MELGRLEYLQALVTEFQGTDSTGNKHRCSLALSVSSVSSRTRPFSLAEAKEQVLANLANFAYDPSNYEYLRQLQVLDLFLDMLTEDNETLVEFAMGKGCPEHPQLAPGQGTAGPALALVVNPPQIHAPKLNPHSADKASLSAEWKRSQRQARPSMSLQTLMKTLSGKHFGFFFLNTT